MADEPSGRQPGKLAVKPTLYVADEDISGPVEQGAGPHRRKHPQSAVECQIRLVENILENLVAEAFDPARFCADSLRRMICHFDDPAGHRPTSLVEVGL